MLSVKPRGGRALQSSSMSARPPSGRRPPGGARPGGGRPKGVPNRGHLEFRQLYDEKDREGDDPRAKTKKMLQRQFAAAEAGNVQAIVDLWDRRFGKARPAPDGLSLPVPVARVTDFSFSVLTDDQLITVRQLLLRARLAGGQLRQESDDDDDPEGEDPES
jgi:hypothetical protein